MRALFAASWLVLTLTASFGCGTGETSVGDADESPTRENPGEDDTDEPTTSTSGGDDTDTAGGATGDFTGNAVDCTTVSLEGESDEPALGFSMTDILAATEGRFDVPVRWTSMCDEEEEPGSACDREAPFVETWAGSETTVRVRITSDGSDAEVRHPTEDQPVCAQGMFIPVELTLESDDGLLDETFESTAWSECGTQSSVDLMLPLETASGALAPSTSDLPPSGWVELTLGFFKDRMWFDLYVVPGDAGPVLTIDLPPFGERTHDVPRTSVELQEGAPLPDESACKIAY